MKVSWMRKHDRATRRRYKKQITLGVLFAAIGILTIFTTGGDITFALFAVPLGIYIALCREKWVEED